MACMTSETSTKFNSKWPEVHNFEKCTLTKLFFKYQITDIFRRFFYQKVKVTICSG
jgi:hypothetical protein